MFEKEGAPFAEVASQKSTKIGGVLSPQNTESGNEYMYVDLYKYLFRVTYCILLNCSLQCHLLTLFNLKNMMQHEEAKSRLE